MVPGVGVEPTNPKGSRILSPLRKPFRHPGRHGGQDGNRTRASRFCRPQRFHFATWPRRSWGCLLALHFAKLAGTLTAPFPQKSVLAPTSRDCAPNFRGPLKYYTFIQFLFLQKWCPPERARLFRSAAPARALLPRLGFVASWLSEINPSGALAVQWK